MELILSAHAVGVLAFFAAGASLALGALSSRAAARRVPSPIAKLPKQEGWRVVAVGRLRVDGPRCNRLEDDAMVAVSSFHETVSRGGWRYELAYCERAPRLHLEAGSVRIALDGPLRIEVGSEELYPGSPLDRLDRRIKKRVTRADVLSSLDPKLPPHGVFRSLASGDPVAVVGTVERDGDRGWRLRPDASGGLTIWYRRRPRIRGPFGPAAVYATAMVL